MASGGQLVGPGPRDSAGTEWLSSTVVQVVHCTKMSCLQPVSHITHMADLYIMTAY